MNSLEFIKKKILKKIKTINEKRNFMVTCKKMNIPFNVELAYKDEKELEYLRQIETELEAWEVVKNKAMGNDYLYEIVIYKSEKDDYEKLQRALEVKNDK